MYKKCGIGCLFLLLVITLILKPRVLFNLHRNILGRVVLVGVVLFFTMFNVTLGLLAALCLIIASNMFFMEGFDNVTIGDDNVDGSLNDGTTVPVETRDKEKAKEKLMASGKDGSKLSEIQAQAETKAQDGEYSEDQGVDRPSIHESIQPKSSKAMPVDKSRFSSDEVSPSESTSSTTSTETFVSSYARV
jgi:hypothetical protein